MRHGKPVKRRECEATCGAQPSSNRLSDRRCFGRGLVTAWTAAWAAFRHLIEQDGEPLIAAELVEVVPAATVDVGIDC